MLGLNGLRLEYYFKKKSYALLSSAKCTEYDTQGPLSGFVRSCRKKGITPIWSNLKPMECDRAAGH